MDTTSKTLDKMTIPELKQVANKAGIKYTSKIKKADLFKAIQDWLTEIALERARAKAAKIKVTKPLTVEQRVANYRRQNGTDRLTTRQLRQVNKCARRMGKVLANEQNGDY